MFNVEDIGETVADVLIWPISFRSWRRVFGEAQYHQKFSLKQFLLTISSHGERNLKQAGLEKKF
jgi:hypothetical protein